MPASPVSAETRPNPGRSVTWVDQDRFEVDGVRFVAAAYRPPESGELLVIKPAGLVRRHLALIEAEAPRRIVELGVKEGGSAALFALVADPDLLVAVDLEARPPAALVDLIAARGLGDRVVVLPGTDQSDRQAFERVLGPAATAEPLDLVVDDASHLLGPTEASFDILFPRLRPGGTYVIEDWSSDLHSAQLVHASLPPGTADPRRQVDKVRSLFALLNSPVGEVPPEIVAHLTEAAAARPVDPAAEADEHGPVRVLRRIAEVAATADLSSLPDPPRPLLDLGVRLLLASVAAPDVIASVRCSNDWLEVRRGTAPVDPQEFRLASLVLDQFGYLP